MQKFYIFIGKSMLKLIGYICIILITSIIVTSYYEDEKEELFFQISDYLDTFEQSIVDDHKIFDAKDLVVDEVKNI